MCRFLVALILAMGVVSAFLSHWSLLDGAPRNSLRLFLDQQAHRPFAYRILAPALVRGADAVLPQAAQEYLADRVAPWFRDHYVQPLGQVFESRIPGISAQADADWSDPRYRRSYVLMVSLMLSTLVAAILLTRRAARLLGASAVAADGAMVLYALILPTLFLEGGYFYDFTEQLGVAALVCCVLQARWGWAFLTVFLMQGNKETALLMVLFLTPLLWPGLRWRMLLPAGLVFGLCVFMLWCIRWAYASAPGQPAEWHLGSNLIFWATVSSWQAREDFYQLGFTLPRMTFLYFALASLILGWFRAARPLFSAALSAFVTLGVLLLCMGSRDEFRNLSLAMPLLVLLATTARPDGRPDAGLPQRA